MSVSPATFCSRASTHPSGATRQQVDAVEKSLCVAIPASLLELLYFSDGFEGWVGPEPNGWYLHLFSTAELLDFNQTPEFKEQRPELIAFGSDGGGEGFYFDPTRPGPPILMLAHVSDWQKDAITYAESMDLFFDRMHAGYNPYKQP